MPEKFIIIGNNFSISLILLPGKIPIFKIDWFFKKERNYWNNLISKFLPLIHRKHYKRLHKLLFNIK